MMHYNGIICSSGQLCTSHRDAEPARRHQACAAGLDGARPSRPTRPPRLAEGRSADDQANTLGQSSYPSQ
jgi:hypothetical protein